MRITKVANLVIEATDATFVDYIQLSQSVPVVVEVYSAQGGATADFSQTLERVVRARQGEVLLVRVNALEAVDVVEALQVRALPALVAFIGGQLAPLCEGPQPEATLLAILDRVCQVAAQNGITGRVSEAEGDDVAGDEQPLDENHQAAADALIAGDYEAARAAYTRARDANPNDTVAGAGLAHIALVERLEGKTLSDIRQTAAAHPDDLGALCDVADLDLSGGHVQDACDRLLTAFVTADKEQRDMLRTRLLDYFLIVGDTDPRIVEARTRLANLLF